MVVRNGETFDFLIVGGGIFGIYQALYLSSRKFRVLLVEREKQLMGKASIVNQARLHSGYHYPRSIKTGSMSSEYKNRFIEEHKRFINSQFNHYYVIDKLNSLTSAQQFERFCETINVPARKVDPPAFLDSSRIHSVYEAEEYSFDSYLIAQYYIERLREKKIPVLLDTAIEGADVAGSQWKIALKSKTDNTRYSVHFNSVINATYSNTNTVNKIFGISPFSLSHEISEISILHVPKMKNSAVTVMDGPFCSLMPFGLSGLHSLSSVVYTHHNISYENEPSFSCQDISPTCTPSNLDNCNRCRYRPKSNFRKMSSHAKSYIQEYVDWNYIFSLFTVKTKLQEQFLTDGRPTVIKKVSTSPDFFVILAGKVNSIYETEKVLANV